jgi:hypothetical protein
MLNDNLFRPDAAEHRVMVDANGDRRMVCLICGRVSRAIKKENGKHEVGNATQRGSS